MTDLNQKVTEEELVARSQYPRVTPAQIEAVIADKKFVYTGLHVTCILTLTNGFTVTGESGCAVPGNYKRDVGERLSYQNAFNQLWPLLGFELKNKVALASSLGQAKTIGTEAKVFVGTKAIWARPMTRGAYNLYRAWQIPANENPDDDGYLVEYPDGHVSWSPKDTFEVSYEEIDVNGEGSQGGPTWQDRLEIEINELKDRTGKLLEFIDGKLFKSLPDFQQKLMTQQLDFMQGYLGVLVARAEG